MSSPGATLRLTAASPGVATWRPRVPRSPVVSSRKEADDLDPPAQGSTSAKMSPLTFALFALVLAAFADAIELTFELPDNARQCFHEEILKDVKCTIEFQVVTGGHYDVDMSLEGPKGQSLYKDVKKQYDSFTWTTDQAGVYTVCFSNEFSTFSHKLVYMDFQVGDDEDELPGAKKESTAMTQMESSSSTVHENLNTVLDYQTHHKLRESQGRKRAEDLNERVFYWSVGQTVVILFIGIGQVIILKNFFSDKKSSLMGS